MSRTPFMQLLCAGGFEGELLCALLQDPRSRSTLSSSCRPRLPSCLLPAYAALQQLLASADIPQPSGGEGLLIPRLFLSPLPLYTV
mmetsp:Transcript_2959/g.9076  ORF Transcript_2959/g.9076 Transcript_2959/m.9076 type:complete len:86 (-) Transcript_2959:119-376(-)